MTCADHHDATDMVLSYADPGTYESKEYWICPTCGRRVEVTHSAYSGRPKTTTVKETKPSKFATEVAEAERKRQESEHAAEMRSADEALRKELEDREHERKRVREERARRETVDYPLDDRKVLDLECQVCGYRKVKPVRIVKLADRGANIFCRMQVTCLDCGKESVTELLDVLDAAELTGSPILKRLASQIAHRRIEAQERARIEAERVDREVETRALEAQKQAAQARERADLDQQLAISAGQQSLLQARKTLGTLITIGLLLTVGTFFWTWDSSIRRVLIMLPIQLGVGIFYLMKVEDIKWMINANSPQFRTRTQDVDRALKLLWTAEWSSLVLSVVAIAPVYLNWNRIEGLHALLVVVLSVWFVIMVFSCLTSD